MEQDFIITKEILNECRSCWEDFQQGKDVSGRIRKTILDSWERCRKMKVDYNRIYLNYLDASSFAFIKQKEKSLLSIAEPILQRIYSKARSTHCAITLANADGIVLRTWQDKWSLWVKSGGILSEQTMGTSGMSTCLITGKQEIIRGAEHYCKGQQDLVCVAQPLLTPEGRLIGGVSISSPHEFYHPHAAIIIQEASISICEQLRLQGLYELEKALIDNFHEGVLVVNSQGKIKDFNRYLQKYLSADKLNEHPDIANIFPKFPVSSLSTKKSFYDRELEIKEDFLATPASDKRFFVSYTPIGKSHNMLTLKPAFELHQYVVEMSGNRALFHFSDIKGISSAINECISQAMKCAEFDLPLLINGENGTGKEMFAQAIHNASSRKDGPFIALNCGALPRDLVQAELFGYEGGAFTGAKKHGNPGKFELADGGTLFLDEIGEMPLDVQVNLLRVLQNNMITRIGSKTSRQVNVRIIAATNVLLSKAVSQKKFREDLFYRLRGLYLHIPALRERPEDIPFLTNFFMQRFIQKHPQFQSCVFSEKAMEDIMGWNWPGNIRELEHTIEQSIIDSDGGVIPYVRFDYDDKPLNAYDGNIAAKPDEPHDDKIDAENKNILISMMMKHNGNVENAAKELGISRSGLYIKLNKYGINAKAYKKIGQRRT